jgi:hypothetical protein
VKAFVGIILIAAAVAALRAMLPKDGKVHRLATAPVLESVIPLGIVAAMAFGLVLIAAALLGKP